MKQLFFLLVVFLIAVSCKVSNTKKNSTEPVSLIIWNNEKAKEHYENRNDSLKWDKEMFLNDLDYVEEESKNPIVSGVFPEPAYNLIGENSFKGVGAFGNSVEVEDKNILYRSFYVKRSNLNKDKLLDKNNQVFFNIVVLTDTLDLKNYNLNSSLVLSRNHPDYIGQGMFKTKKVKIDFVAFTTVEDNAYAIVNMRLFDLKFGKTILIAPQTDKSLRSLQVEMPILEFKELENYMSNLLKKKRIIEFLTKKGNI